MRRYLRYGGLPHLVDLELTDRVVYEYLGNLYHVILFKDVVARYRIRNIDFLERLVRFVADSVGSVVTAKRISDYLKSQRVRISPNAVLEYLAHLCHACFLAKVHRADVVGRRIFEIGEKYYFEDLGLRHAVSRSCNGTSAKCSRTSFTITCACAAGTSPPAAWIAARSTSWRRARRRPSTCRSPIS